MAASACSKTTYTTRRWAKEAARHVKSVGKGNIRSPWRSTVLRPYLCSKCGLWHLTSKRAARY